MQLSRPRVSVSVATQTVSLWDGFRQVKTWPCSTSKYGTGFQEGSNKTPIGFFRVMEKYGAGADLHTIFKSRQPVGQWDPTVKSEDDMILGRILWLEGDEARNENTKGRYIYFHGTNQEERIGQAGSHGCIRLRNPDIVEFYDLVEIGTPVWIEE